MILTNHTNRCCTLHHSSGDQHCPRPCKEVPVAERPRSLGSTLILLQHFMQKTSRLLVVQWPTPTLRCISAAALSVRETPGDIAPIAMAWPKTFTTTMKAAAVAAEKERGARRVLMLGLCQPLRAFLLASITSFTYAHAAKEVASRVDSLPLRTTKPLLLFLCQLLLSRVLLLRRRVLFLLLLRLAAGEGVTNRRRRGEGAKLLVGPRGRASKEASCCGMK